MRGLISIIDSLRRRFPGTRPRRRGGATADPEAAVLDRLEDRGELGKGGMSAVRRVFDRHLHRELALKLLPEDRADARHRHRFVDEARIMGRLEHPHIVPVHELDTDKRGARYFTMKLVQGTTLHEMVNRHGRKRLEPDALGDLLRVLVKACEAVAFAHSHGVIHRDIKPANIMVGDFGQVYLMDWGLALVREGARGEPTPSSHPDATRRAPDQRRSVVGTPAYMAPEQARGLAEAVDERADVFSLGASLYHVLTGRPPYLSRDWTTMVRMALQRQCRPPERIAEAVPPGLARIAMTAMAAEPEERYASVNDLRAAVEEFLRGGWHLPRVRYPSGARIVEQGATGDRAYIIARGRCAVVKSTPEGDQQMIKELDAGSVFGETALLTRAPRIASVDALEDVELMELTATTLSESFGLSSWMAELVTSLAERFRERDERVAELERELHRRDAGAEETGSAGDGGAGSR